MAQNTFEIWMKKVDQELEARCGLVSLDLADMPYRDWYEDGYTPSEAAQEALENEGFPA